MVQSPRIRNNKQSNKQNRWIIDPIDGTFNFLNGIPQFAISIGYEEQNEIKCGVIFNPILNKCFVLKKEWSIFKQFKNKSL